MHPGVERRSPIEGMLQQVLDIRSLDELQL